jgi:eukaryotic-like serine/threonine-protein kinase
VPVRFCGIVLASLNRANIAAIYGVEDADQQRVLVLELVEGETLAERIARGALPLDEALTLAIQIAEAVEAAHEKDVVHRDLKPANIKLTADGRVKVLDFGLAKAFEGSSAEPSISNSPTLTVSGTAHGVILGTAAYMSPEQARGQPVDHRADIWAFGCILYEMLSGRRAFRGDHVSDILASVLAREPDMTELPAAIPPRLKDALRRCFEKHPKRRWQAIGDLRVELEQILAHPNAGVAEVAPRVNRAAVVIAAVVAGVAAASVAWFLKPAPAAEPRPVVRFDFQMPPGQVARPQGRAVVAMSPDGRHFAYNTTTGVYLRALDTLASRLIPGTEAPLSNPVLSPDGDWLAYWSVGAQALQKISIGGGAPVTIAAMAAPFGASWGRDGTILVGQPDSILRVSADGGSPTALITMNAGEIPYGPSLLPDGRTILYSVTRTAGPNRWNVAEIVAQQPGGERKVLIRGGADATYVPTGHLLYAAGNVLYAIAFDVDALETSGGPVPLIDGVQRVGGAAVATGTANYGLSDRGTLVYVGQLAPAAAPEGALGVADRAGMVKLLNVPRANYRSPRASPDGRHVAVETVTSSNQNVIWVYDMSGASAIRRLTQEGNNTRPIWSADATRIAYGQTAEKNAGIFWQPADGSGLPERLTTAPDGYWDFPESFSPDGRVLLFARVKPPLVANSWALMTLSLDGADPTPKVFFDLPNSNEFGATFSPDGKWVAYASNGDPNPTNPAENFAVYVQPYPPTGVKYQISQTAGAWPIWTAGGRELIYRPNNNPGEGVTRLNVVTITTRPAPAFTSEKTLPIEGFQTVTNYREYDVLPGGRGLVMVFPGARGQAAPLAPPQIHAVLNWTEELKARVPTSVR